MQRQPLILTLLLDEISQQYFDRLRKQYFPKHCNFLNAHLTLFHNLPAGKPVIAKTLEKLCSIHPFSLEVTRLKSIGNGVAFELKSPELMELHSTLQQQFSPHLIRKDRLKLWPHVTVQNKVTAFKASQTLALLQQDFKPFTVQATGIGSWLYKDGPWEKAAEYPFNALGT